MKQTKNISNSEYCPSCKKLTLTEKIITCDCNNSDYRECKKCFNLIYNVIKQEDGGIKKCENWQLKESNKPKPDQIVNPKYSICLNCNSIQHHQPCMQNSFDIGWIGNSQVTQIIFTSCKTLTNSMEMDMKIITEGEAHKQSLEFLYDRTDSSAKDIF